MDVDATIKIPITQTNIIDNNNTEYCGILLLYRIKYTRKAIFFAKKCRFERCFWITVCCSVPLYSA